VRYVNFVEEQNYWTNLTKPGNMVYTRTYPEKLILFHIGPKATALHEVQSGLSTVYFNTGLA